MLTETPTLHDVAELRQQDSEVIRSQHAQIVRLNGEAKVLRALLDEARDFIPDFEYALLDKIASAIRGTV